MDDLDSFGEWLRQRRMALGLTRPELAERVGCSVSALRKIEADERRPSLQLAELLAGCLRIPPEEQPVFLDAARGTRRVARLGAPAPPLAPLPLFPAPTASVRPSVPVWNLPAPMTPFLGREAELATLAHLLDDPGCRLLTLAGPGGIGKTRLAVEVACNVWERFADGVFFASLAATRSPEFVVPAIAQAVGLNFSGPADPRTQLVNHLRNKQALLLLDNLEHLLEGVEEVAALLAAAPGVKVLATSRERLELSGEWVFEVQGLPVPAEGQVEGLEQYSAVQLFLQKSQRTQVDFELPVEACDDVVRICRLVEGMPLALELAAAWVGTLTCAEIADEIERGLDILATRLRDVPARQRSLRAVFEHSWQLLTQDEQRALRQLAVFHGGFTRQAAESLAGVALSMLSSLMAKSLVRRTSHQRYDLHPLIHQHAAEKLVPSDDTDRLRSAHSRHYLGALHTLEADIKGGRQQEALGEIEGDIENIRAAWQWAVTQRDLVGLDHGLETLYLFFEIRNRYREGAAVLLLAEEKVADDARAQWARIAIRRSILRCAYQPPHPELESCIREALEVARQAGSAVEAALALFALGIYHAHTRNEYAVALPFFEESLQAFEAQADRFYTTWALGRIATCKLATSGLDAFFAYTRRCLALAEATGNKVEVNRSLYNLSSLEITQGAYSAAEAGLERAMALAVEIGDRDAIAYITANVGLLRFLNGAFEEAIVTAQRSLALAQDSRAVSFSLSLLGILAAVMGDYAAAMRYAHESQELPSTIVGQWLSRLPVAMASCGLQDFELARQEVRSLFQTAFHARWTAMVAWPLPVAAIILADEGQAVRSVETLALASTHPFSATGWIERWSLLEELRARLEDELSSELYQRAWNRGQSLELEEVVLDLLAED